MLRNEGSETYVEVKLKLELLKKAKSFDLAFFNELNLLGKDFHLTILQNVFS